MKQASRYFLITTLGLTFSGCATQQTLTEEAAYQQYPAVAELGQKLEQARNDEIPVFSPDLYNASKDSYNEALQQAMAGDPKATATATKSLSTLSRANQTAENSREVLEEVVKVRDKARNANAPSLNAEAYQDAEEQFMALTRDVEQGNIADAKAGRADVMRAYSQIELTALKGSTVEAALEAINKAKAKDVDEIAPKTFNKAMEEYNLAKKTLDADRTDTEKASVHAGLAVWNVDRATQISEIITGFKASDFSAEDQVLWYQQQVGRIVAPVEPNVAYNLPNKDMVKGLNQTLTGLMTSRDELDQQLTDVTVQKSQESKRQQAFAAKFAFIQNLYSATEAEVYRQQDNVLIRAQGFAFKPGTSEIDATNFALMNKIIQSISQFPNSKIVVSGHTDNTGNEQLNLKLSQERAEKVAQFLIEVGKIPSDRIEAVGYGKDRPVANNETTAGRAANRRVEVLIENS